jgi:hypothetical protein
MAEGMYRGLTSVSVRKEKEQGVIRVKVDQNPRKPGSKASDCFEQMLGSPTVQDYLWKCRKVGIDDERARGWLRSSIQKGYAEILG